MGAGEEQVWEMSVREKALRGAPQGFQGNMHPRGSLSPPKKNRAAAYVGLVDVSKYVEGGLDAVGDFVQEVDAAGVLARCA